MKRILSLFFIASIAVNNVYSIEIDGINYNFDEATLTASVVLKNPKYSGNIILPSSVAHAGKTYTVTKIESYAFEDCSGLKYIRIPESVIEIGGMAFVNCTELDSIDIETGVSTIVAYAFANCTKLRSITIPSSVTSLEHNAFEGDTNLVTANILGSIQFLEEFTFKNCTNLRFFDVPASVQSLSGRAFENCISLDSITLHEGLINLGYDAIGCENLRNITLPSTLLHMYGSLWSCSKIEYIRSYAVNPPDCTASCFANINKSIPVYVPAGSGHLYRSAQYWKSFSNIIEEGNPTGFNPINTSNKDNKIICNGQIYILRGDKLFTLQGQEVK